MFSDRQEPDSGISLIPMEATASGKALLPGSGMGKPNQGAMPDESLPWLGADPLLCGPQMAVRGRLLAVRNKYRADRRATARGDRTACIQQFIGFAARGRQAKDSTAFQTAHSGSASGSDAAGTDGRHGRRRS